MISSNLAIRKGRIIIFILMLFIITANLNSNLIFSNPKSIGQDSLKLKVISKIDELKNAAKDLYQLIEWSTPENFSPEELHNWYEQTTLILEIRNVIEIYLIDFRKMLDEWNYLSHQPVEGDFVQMKMEFESVLLNYINSGKEFISLTTNSEERMEKAFTIIESVKK
ncbi:hypothetical protein ACFLSV_03030 [Bacteroidota bacterium]